MRSKNGQRYSRSTTNGIRASINRHLKSPPYSRQISLYSDKAFLKSNQAHEAVLKQLVKDGLDRPKSYDPITGNDLKKCLTGFDTNTPKGLQNKVWFDIHYNFARRANEGDRDMTKDTFEVRIDSIGKKYLVLAANEITKNHQGGMKDTNNTEPRCYENGGPMCPVAAFQKYVGYLHPGLNALWQRPRDFPNIAKKEEAQTWYCNSPVGDNTLKTKMATISEEFGLSRRYTNHCIRSSAITCLNDADVEARHIATITKHKNLASIDSYVRDASEAQKRSLSRKLQQVPQATSPSTDENHENYPQHEHHKKRRLTSTTSSLESAAMTSSASVTSRSTASATPGLNFAGCTINTINISYGQSMSRTEVESTQMSSLSLSVEEQNTSI